MLQFAMISHIVTLKCETEINLIKNQRGICNFQIVAFFSFPSRPFASVALAVVNQLVHFWSGSNIIISYTLLLLAITSLFQKGVLRLWNSSGRGIIVIHFPLGSGPWTSSKCPPHAQKEWRPRVPNDCSITLAHIKISMIWLCVQMALVASRATFPIQNYKSQGQKGLFGSKMQVSEFYSSCLIKHVHQRNWLSNVS